MVQGHDHPGRLVPEVGGDPAVAAPVHDSGQVDAVPSSLDLPSGDDGLILIVPSRGPHFQAAMSLEPGHTPMQWGVGSRTKSVPNLVGIARSSCAGSLAVWA